MQHTNPSPGTPSPNPAQPQWQPPAHLDDPLVAAVPVDRAVWSVAIRGRLPRLSDYAVARAAADYGNKNGGNIFPGVERLAEDLCTTTKTVKTALAWLTEHGWLILRERGNRRQGQANRYALSVPAPIATTILVKTSAEDQAVGAPKHRWLWRDPNRPQWIERPDWEPKRESARGSYERPAALAKAGRGGAIRGSTDGSEEVLAPDQGVITSPQQEIDPGISLQPSEWITRGHARARPKPPAPPSFDPDDIDIAEQIAAEAERRLGHPLGLFALRKIDGMLMDGCHPRFILNAAVAEERKTTA